MVRKGTFHHRGVTLVELILAGVLSLVLFAVFWSLMRQSNQATSRMSEVMKLMDGAMIQTRMDEDIRTSMQVIDPPLLVMSPSLSFYNRQYERVTYTFKPAPSGKEANLERTVGKNGKPSVIARRIKDGRFYRTGPNLVEYEITFLPVHRPGGSKKSRDVEISISSKVFLGNGIY